MSGLRRRCSFWVMFAEPDTPMAEIAESYCIDAAEALAQASEIYVNPISAIVLLRFY